MADKYKFAKDYMRAYVHSGPGINYPHTGLVYGENKEEYTVTETKGNWLKAENVGWICRIDKDGSTIFKKVKTNSAKKVEAEKEEKKEEEIDEESYAYVPTHELIQTSEAEFDDSLENNFTISNIRGIFGMPYQFMESADPRIETRSSTSDTIGRKYAREIVAPLPILLMTAGKPIFMGKYSSKDRKTILKDFVDIFAGDDNKLLDTVFSEEYGKYYSLEYAYKEYFKYVNPMCRVAARMMNVHNIEVDGEKLGTEDWSFKSNNNFNKLFSVYRGCTAWYCDSDTNVSDSFGNSTTESLLASKVNTVSEYGRELNFILGTVKSETGVALDKFVSQDNLNQNMENMEDFVNKTLGNSGLSGIFGSIANTAQTALSGGKIVFPEIWSSSDFSRQYNVNLKLVSPDGDNLSVYLNIIVPMLHLLGFVLPREAEKSHGYISPFLVRAFYKGMFNVDMGIIIDLQFTKGKESAWTASGVPTVVEVSFTIKDLYSDLYMTNMDGIKYNMMNNIMLMDYISNTCGVNINDVDIRRSIELFLMMNIENRVKDTYRINIVARFDQFVTNKWANIFSKF